MKIHRLLLALAMVLLVEGCGAATPPVTTGTGDIHTNEMDTSATMPKGFNLEQEALPLLELCIELNSDPGEKVDINTSQWDRVGGITADFDDPKSKGVGYFNNAWKLWRRKGTTNEFAIVIRGTQGNAKSILADVKATSVSAIDTVIKVGKGQELDFRLSSVPGAETHLGFTYSLAALMFYRDNGILATLNDEKLVPRGSRLYITGHSQGAAIATLVHAFLHYAINDPGNRYHLRDKGFALKSYVFAQPKPGNWQFSMDFSRVAGAKGTAFVINNSLDWVPQLPLTIEFLSEPVSDLAREKHPGDPEAPTLIGMAAGTLKGGRSLFAGLGEHTADDRMARYHDTLDPTYLRPAGTVARKKASSLNYWSCGNLVPVFGDHKTSAYPHDGWLTQHHGPTYRTLMQAQL